MLNSLSKEVSVPTLECTSIPSHEECESDPQGSMSREVDPKGCHLLEKSSQLVSQSTEPIKRSVEIHAGSEELLPFPGDRALTSGKTAEREEEENAEVVNGDHQSKEGSGSDENCVGSVSAQAGSERNCESFPDDSSEDPVEGSDSSIKPKIPLSDPVVVPNFFLPPQEMEASMRLLSTSSHPSASPEGPSATMVGLKPPEVPPTATMKFISAGMAGCITDLCTFPLDTAKVRLQAAHLRVPAGLGVPAGPGVPTPALSRHRRGHAAPGWLHHGGCGRGLCAAHRRGQGAVPGQRGPVGQRAPLQQRWGRLPHHRQGGGDPRALERDAAQHRPQCRHQLRGARHLRPHQGRAAAGTAHGRQRPVPLRGRLWRRVLCHSGGIAGGRGEDAVHEHQPRAVQQRPELPPGPAHAGWPRRPLQGGDEHKLTAIQAWQFPAARVHTGDSLLKREMTLAEEQL
ncbi:uncharacterized protein LOC116997366 isoform X3 [Catharus ustulatus]|uniref:uncharacterized protein LOC116997366 isoform X3 n=1 Tax=Catharus ustulatus TaxID=91951 RepID=UPI00140CBFAA|nr:uncharacterized protein LOC116997366 isoform X3 [Catharus ustulatus]